MAHTLLTVLGQTEQMRDIALHGPADDEPADRWIDAGIVTQCNRTIHNIYFTLIDMHVIKPEHPEREKGGIQE
jgi:hypothetical protein